MPDILAENLKKKGYTVACFAQKEEASAYLNVEIDGITVGMGGSVTLGEMRLGESLSTHNTVYWHQGVTTPEESAVQRRGASQAEVYISSVNGISLSGEIVNIDGNCNRVSATLSGHRKVYFVLGKNKLAPDLAAAIDRARNIAAPLNAKRLNRKTPCVKGGHCFDCSSSERICRALCVLWEKPSGCDYEVVLIDETLGY